MYNMNIHVPLISICTICIDGVYDSFIHNSFFVWATPFILKKKVAKENQDKWAQKMFPFLKGFLARCQNVSLSISYFVFMFCFIFFMTQLGQKMRSTFSFYFVMTDISWNKYLPIRDNYYFIVSIWNRVTTVYFYHLLKIGV